VRVERLLEPAGRILCLLFLLRAAARRACVDVAPRMLDVLSGQAGDSATDETSPCVGCAHLARPRSRLPFLPHLHVPAGIPSHGPPSRAGIMRYRLLSQLDLSLTRRQMPSNLTPSPSALCPSFWSSSSGLTFFDPSTPLFSLTLLPRSLSSAVRSTAEFVDPSFIRMLQASHLLELPGLCFASETACKPSMRAFARFVNDLGRLHLISSRSQAIIPARFPSIRRFAFQ